MLTIIPKYTGGFTPYIDLNDAQFFSCQYYLITLGNNQKIVWNFLTDSEPFLCPESKNNIDFAESGQISRFREFP